MEGPQERLGNLNELATSRERFSELFKSPTAPLAALAGALLEASFGNPLL
jgi:2-keto-4-pentenoate hydratase